MVLGGVMIQSGGVFPNIHAVHVRQSKGKGRASRKVSSAEEGSMLQSRTK